MVLVVVQNHTQPQHNLNMEVDSEHETNPGTDTDVGAEVKLQDKVSMEE